MVASAAELREHRSITQFRGQVVPDRTLIAVSEVDPTRGRYLENVPAIVPLLEKEYRNAAQRLTATQEELTDLAPERLKEKVRRVSMGHHSASLPQLMLSPVPSENPSWLHRDRAFTASGVV